MRRYLFKRMWQMLPTTFGILVLTFMLFHVVGGSPAEVVLGKNATAEALAAFDTRFGYDKPLLLGRWSTIRALPPLESRPLESAVQQGSCELPLTYALPPGNYRLNTSHVQLEQRDSRGERTVKRLAGTVPCKFTVPSGCSVTRLVVSEPLPRRLLLEKGNRHWLDSQFINYLAALCQGDLGLSTEHNLPVARVLAEGIGPSLALTIPILLGGTILALMLATLCAAWRNSLVDRSLLLLSTLLMSVNYVVWVLGGQFFLAYKLHLFPIWGFESAGYLILPVLIGIVSGLGRDLRFYRAVILDEIFKLYVRTAEAKGLRGWRIMLRHVLRNSLIPIITYISLSIPFLFTGSLMLESFFGIPGLGNVSLNAINSSDMAIVRAVVILGALLYQLVNLITDLCYAWLDPRVRLG